MGDYLARSVDTLKQRAHELETQIARIRADIQAAGHPEQRPLLLGELNKVVCGMDDLNRQLDDVRSPVAPFFLF